MDVAQAPLSAPRELGDLIVLGQVGDRFARIQILDHGARGHAQHHVFRALAAALSTSAFFTVACAMDAGEAVFDEGVDIAVRNRKQFEP